MNRIKRVKMMDFADILFLIFIVPFAIFYKLFCQLFNKKIILIGEDPNEASDNGFALFKYMHSEGYSNIYYVIKRNSPQRYKLDQYNESVLNYRSPRHWIYYLTAYRNVNIHKAGSPSPALFYVLQKFGVYNGNRVFLQHGITMNNVAYLHYKECKFKYFITASVQEDVFIRDNFGYPDEAVRLLGFSRYDKLWENRLMNHENEIYQVAILPTWRKYLIDLTDDAFMNTEYFIQWQQILDDISLNKKTCESMKFTFLLHRNLKKFTHLFDNNGLSNLEILTVDDMDISEVIGNHNALITDYSSISIDFAYVNRPVVYYQFDQKNFKERHLGEGYFSYEEDGFGPVFFQAKQCLEYVSVKRLEMEEAYGKKSIDFFGFKDNENSRRIAKLLMED